MKEESRQGRTVNQEPRGGLLVQMEGLALERKHGNIGGKEMITRK